MHHIANGYQCSLSDPMQLFPENARIARSNVKVLQELS